MGFKKGRAARAAANEAASAAAQSASNAAVPDSLNIWNDGGSCVHYTASNGSEYKIDVATLEQTNVRKGTRRVVHRRKVHDKSFTMWQFEAARPSRSKMCTDPGISYMQYPKWVQFALDERWKHVQHIQSSSSESLMERANLEAWQRVVNNLDELTFASLFDAPAILELNVEGQGIDLSETLSALDAEGNLDANHAKSQIRRLVSADKILLNALFDRLANTVLSPLALGHAVRWLLQSGFQPSASHCRRIALSSGSLTALRVLIVEASVDVCGFELLEPGAISPGKHCPAGNSGWVQHCKHALKLLLARGAVLGGQASRSKLLKRLEVDGDVLWARRILDAMSEAFPDFVIQQLCKFLGCP